jgi:phenylalanine-4-hydroxylase
MLAPHLNPHLADDDYRQRREAIALMAAGPHREPDSVDYRAVEHQTWAAAREALFRRWQQVAAPEILEANERLGLPADEVPQLNEVTARLRLLSGFRYRAVPGLVPVEQFFGALANGVFLSTQYLRHHSSPLYTPEPDIIHEVLGHATCLAVPALADLHRAAGRAILRVEAEESRQFLADVFWFSAEFGVIGGLAPDGSPGQATERPKAYGAGLLSSFGELDSFQNSLLWPLNVAAMGAQAYDINTYQPVLFAARSMSEVSDVVGGFFDEATDDLISAVRRTVVSPESS